jgi:hypothetical protein
MKLGWDALDQEIHAVEAALATDRTHLSASLKGCVEGARNTAVETITAPKFILGTLGVGFIVGRFLMRGRRKASHNANSAREDSGHDHKTATRRVLGLLGATAFSLINRQFGGPLGLARWAISHMPARSTARTKNSAGFPRAP